METSNIPNSPHMSAPSASPAPAESLMVGTSLRRSRRRSREMDALRARALGDDPLTNLTDSDREWVWRSLLKRVRLRQAAELAGIAWADTATLDRAIARTRRRYLRRLAQYHKQKHPPNTKVDYPPLPVRPEVIMADSRMRHADSGDGGEATGDPPCQGARRTWWRPWRGRG